MVATTKKIHTTHYDFMPGFKKEVEVYEKEIVRGWKVDVSGQRRGKTEQSWPRIPRDVTEIAYKQFMNNILDKTGKNFNPARTENGTPVKDTGASHVITDIIRIKTKDKGEFLYTKGTIMEYDSLGDLASFHCSKPEVWTRTLFGHKRDWDPEEKMVVTQTLGPNGEETVYELPFNEKNLKELFNNRNTDDINFVLKEEQGGEARQVKDINSFKTLELFQKPFEYLWNADYLSAQMKAELRSEAQARGLIGPTSSIPNTNTVPQKSTNLGIG